MKNLILIPLMLMSSTAIAQEGDISVGLMGGALFTDQLEVLGNTVVIKPRVGYWLNPTLGFEADFALMPAGQTRDGVPETFGYFGFAPTANMVGRLYEDKPINPLVMMGLGAFFKSVNDDGALDLPTGTNVDVDLLGRAGIGLMVPFGDLAVRTDLNWLLNVGSENHENRGDSFIDWEWSLGLIYLPGGPKDSDKDGIVDEDDTCADQPEDIDEFEDTDGCPDLDNDGDGVADTDDGCPNDAEDMDGFEDENGCPELDNDDDGVPDKTDECPLDEGTRATNGCPDQDGDTLADTEDECPKEAGEVAAFGCPDQDGDRVPDHRDDCPEEAAPEGIDPRRSDGCVKKMYVAQGKIVILEKVQFASGSSTIRSGSFELLDQVGGSLKKNKGIKKVQIEGHTDSQGNDDYNLKLSQERADAVKNYLVEKGEINGGRLVAKGFGETKPIEDNETREGRDANRRVEFNILEDDIGMGAKKKIREGLKSGNVEKIDEDADDDEGVEGAGATRPGGDDAEETQGAKKKAMDAAEEAGDAAEEAMDGAKMKAMDASEDAKKKAAEAAEDAAEEAEDAAEEAADGAKKKAMDGLGGVK